jgi:hypothetical protein
MRNRHRRTLPSLLALAAIIAACVTASAPRAGNASQHRWWSQLGPVIPHDNFPAECNLCHVGDTWDTLVDDFSFNHEKETGVPLIGAHADAYCLRCHNDRGPVLVFAERGCTGCHQDPHEGELGKTCLTCHDRYDWQNAAGYEQHVHTRFPLTGAHAAVSCHRCHPGSRVGEFMPTDMECLACHADDLANALVPPHAVLGWVDNCDRCHLTTTWQQATVQNLAQRVR